MSMSRFASISLLCLLSGACTVVIKPSERSEPAPENTEPEPRPQPTPRQPTPRPTPVPRTTEPERPPPAPPPARTTPAPSRRGVPRLNVPRGHLPSAGMCRVWIENMAPGRQARQASCQGILAAAPAGAWILYRPAHTPGHMRVRYVNPRQAGQIVAVRVYDAQSSQYLQELALADDDDNMGPIVAQATPVQRPPETGRPVTPPGREGRNGGGSTGGTDTTAVGRRNGNGNSGQADTAQADTTTVTNGNGNNNGRRGNGNANGNSGNGNNGNANAGNNGNGNANAGNDQEGPGSRGAGADTPLETGGQPPLSVEVRSFPQTGQCRVWMPGRAEGQQARSRSCNGISREAPAGAWILRRMRGQTDVIYVDYVDERRGGTVVKTSVFDSTTRAFLR